MLFKQVLITVDELKHELDKEWIEYEDIALEELMNDYSNEIVDNEVDDLDLEKEELTLMEYDVLLVLSNIYQRKNQRRLGFNDY